MFQFLFLRVHRRLFSEHRSESNREKSHPEQFHLDHWRPVQRRPFPRREPLYRRKPAAQTIRRKT